MQYYPNQKKLDLIYKIYSSDPPKFLGGATESQARAEKSPQTTAGLTEAGSPYHFTPSGGYDRSDGAFGGGRIRITPNLGGFHLFDTFTAAGNRHLLFRPGLALRVGRRGRWIGVSAVACPA